MLNGAISDIDTEKNQFYYKKNQHRERNGYKIIKPQEEIIYNVPEKEDISDTVSVKTEIVLPKLNEVEIKTIQPVERVNEEEFGYNPLL